MTKNASFNFSNQRSVRDGIGAGLILAGKNNPDVIVLTADLAESTKASEFDKVFPQRFIEVGVAEQNMAGIAAGLALSGKIPFMASYAVFSPGRNWDQIRVSICINNANVKIIGGHAGFSAGPDGPTHQALEDIAITRVLPNMVVLSPCDYTQTVAAVQAAAVHKGPVYIRSFKESSPTLTPQDQSFAIGTSYVMRQGNDVTIVSAGPILANVMQAAQKLAEKNIMCQVINAATIKPLDQEPLLESAKKTGKVVTVEEHQVTGGLGSAVCEVLAQTLPTKTLLIGVKDKYGESGTHEELLKKHHLDVASLVSQIEKFV